MPRTKEEFEQIRNKSRKAIMETALELFATKGFYSTSISQIAKQAGVSKGLMYNYFESKDDLLKAILMDAYDEGSQLITEEMKIPDTPKEHLKHIIEGFRQMLKTRLQHWKLLTALAFQEDAYELISSEVLPKKDVLIKQFVHLFEEMGYEKPKEEAYMVGAMMDGIGMHYMTLVEKYPLDEMINHLIDKYCK